LGDWVIGGLGNYSTTQLPDYPITQPGQTRTKKKIERGSNGFNGLTRIFLTIKLIRSNQFNQLNPRSTKFLYNGQEVYCLDTNYPA